MARFVELGEGGVPCLNRGVCPNFVDEYSEEALCGMCRDGQAPVTTDAVPQAIDDVPTVKVVTPTEDEMVERMEQRRMGVAR